jgi:hypothetical protein
MFDSSDSSGSRASIPAALSDVMTHGHQLLMNRLDLMQVELRETGRQAVMRGVELALSGLLAFSGFVLLTAAAVMFLAQQIGQPLALLGCGAAYAVVGLALVVRARKAHIVQISKEFVPGSSHNKSKSSYND